MKDYLNAVKPAYSFEIFPPKGKNADLSSIFATIDELASLSPDLISVTYGAGGTSRENTVEIATKIQNCYNIPSVAHLTCAGTSREELTNILDKLEQNGVKQVLALRGDLAEGETLGDFKYASELIEFIKKHYDFTVFAACYPEKHPQAATLKADIENLKRKVDAGADILITQLFLSNRIFYRFRDKAREAGIKIPIEAGIMPLTSTKQTDRMVLMCGASLPVEIISKIEAYGHNSMAMKEAGIAYAVEQISDLLANSVDGIHLYTMNQPSIAKRISESIRGMLYSRRVKRD